MLNLLFLRQIYSLHGGKIWQQITRQRFRLRQLRGGGGLCSSPQGISFVQNIYRDEIRDGYLVTSQRKKVWQRQLEILTEIDRICKANDIKYFVDYGALLGAVRHKGFIPWDDDLDISMLRPDYERFVTAAKKSISDSFAVLDNYTGWPNQYAEGYHRVCAFTKICHKGTSAIVDFDDTVHPQGLMLDVFPLDIVPDGSARLNNLCNSMAEIYLAVLLNENFYNHIREGKPTLVPPKVLLDLYNKPLAHRYYVFEQNAAHLYGEINPTMVGLITEFSEWKSPLRRSWLEETVLLPFEMMLVPCPQNYEEVLTARFGDWHEPVIYNDGLGHSGVVTSSDIPYTEYLAKINRSLLPEYKKVEPKHLMTDQ